MKPSGDLQLVRDYLFDFWQAVSYHWLTLPFAGTVFMTADNQSVTIWGRVLCSEDLHVDVDLDLLIVRSRPALCAVIGYSFHAQRGRVPLFRYDDADHYPGHPTPHHKHLFDLAGDTLDQPEHVGAIPSLAEVLDELGATIKGKETKPQDCSPTGGV